MAANRISQKEVELVVVKHGDYNREIGSSINWLSSIEGRICVDSSMISKLSRIAGILPFKGYEVQITVISSGGSIR